MHGDFCAAFDDFCLLMNLLEPPPPPQGHSQVGKDSGSEYFLNEMHQNFKNKINVL